MDPHDRTLTSGLLAECTDYDHFDDQATKAMHCCRERVTSCGKVLPHSARVSRSSFEGSEISSFEGACTHRHGHTSQSGNGPSQSGWAGHAIRSCAGRSYTNAMRRFACLAISKNEARALGLPRSLLN